MIYSPELAKLLQPHVAKVVNAVKGAIRSDPLLPLRVAGVTVAVAAIPLLVALAPGAAPIVAAQTLPAAVHAAKEIASQAPLPDPKKVVDTAKAALPVAAGVVASAPLLVVPGPVPAAVVSVAAEKATEAAEEAADPALEAALRRARAVARGGQALANEGKELAREGLKEVEKAAENGSLLDKAAAQKPESGITTSLEKLSGK